jgi:hypothetical protein
MSARLVAAFTIVSATAVACHATKTLVPNDGAGGGPNDGPATEVNDAASQNDAASDGGAICPLSFAAFCPPNFPGAAPLSCSGSPYNPTVTIATYCGSVPVYFSSAGFGGGSVLCAYGPDGQLVYGSNCHEDGAFCDTGTPHRDCCQSGCLSAGTLPRDPLGCPAFLNLCFSDGGADARGGATDSAVDSQPAAHE